MAMTINATGQIHNTAAAIRPVAGGWDAVVADTACTVLSLFREDPAFTTSSAGAVSSLANLKVPANPFTNGTAGRRPILTDDSILGRKTGRFQADYTSFMTSTNTIDYRLPFTLWTVFRGAPDSGKLFQTLIGRYDAAMPERAALVLRSDGEVAAMYGSANPLPGHPYRADRWALAIMAYSGNGSLAVRLGASPWEFATVVTEPLGTTNQLQLGFNASGGATFSGSMDAVGVYNADLSAAVNAGRLNRLLAAVRANYGMAVSC